MIKLNRTSYCHVNIRYMCYQIERNSGMKLQTELGDNFEKIEFSNKYGYIKIDYLNNTCYVLGYKLSKKDIYLLDYIMVSCNWLEMGNQIKLETKKRKRM